MKSITLIPLTLSTIVLAACGGGGGSGNNSQAHPPPEAQINAVANTPGGTVVSLNGSNSTAQQEPSSLIYRWKHVDNSGVSVDINNANSSQASFIAPRLLEPVTLTLELTVEDSAGNTSSTTTDLSVDVIKFFGEAPGDYFDKVGAAGDVNQDGYSDIIIGARGYNSRTGKAYVYSGKDYSLLFSKTGEHTFSRFGVSVSTAGDYNNDGYADVIIGSDDYNRTGKAYVYSGADNSLLFSLEGENRNDSFGSRVSTAGDFNADGYSDVIVGAPWYDGTAGIDTGKFTIYSGLDNSQLFSQEGEQTDLELGHRVSTAGDFNGDGFADIVSSTYGSSGGDPSRKGKVYVYSGLDHSLLFYKEGENAGDLFQANISMAGDFNADGRDDIVIGASEYDGVAGHNTGKLYVYSGLDNSLLFSVEGEGEFDNFSSGASLVGDFNGDGHADVVASALYHDGAAGDETGKVYVYSGADNSLLFSQEGQSENARFGIFIAAAGDVNNDNYADIVIGERGDDNKGTVHVIFGGPSAL